MEVRLQDQELLQRHEERLRLAQQTARIGTFEWNIQTGVDTWTPELELIYGLPPGGFSGTQAAWEDLLHPDDRAGVIELAKQSLKTGTPMQAEWRIVWPDGSIHWIAGRWQVFMDTSGEPARMVGVNIDITERKRSEERLLEYEKAVEGAEDMIGVIDREYRFLLANRQYLKMQNLTREQVVGHLIPEVLTKEIFETVIRPKLDECFQGQVVKYEGKFSYPVAGERDLMLSYFPIEGVNGVDRAACILHDITDRKRAEEALRESEERLRLAVQAGRMFAYSWDAATDVIQRSGESEDILGVPNNQVNTGAAVSAMVHPEDRQQLQAALADLTVEHPNLSITYRIIRPDGVVIWVERNSRGYFDSQGNLKRLVGMVVDVTERKKAKEALAEMTRRLIAAQEQERARIARELHDDVNQRIALLSVELEQLQQSPTEIQSRVQELRKELRQISDDVQAISHDLHSSKLEYLGAIAGMKSWCREVAERHKSEVVFRSEFMGNLPLDLGLPLFRVLQEAVNNSIKHSGEKRVEVQLWEHSGEIHLIVRDSGRGFDVETAMRGKGLGLTSMTERVRLVNGTIAIESRPMEGTNLHVRIPLEQQSKAEPLSA
jgi:PAS domain S-box-containing protein